jgi:hypothetical protein
MTEAERALLADASVDELKEAATFGRNRAEFMVDALDRARSAMEEFMKRFGGGWDGDRTLEDVLAALSPQERTEAERLVKEWTDADLVTGMARTEQDMHAAWLAGEVQVLDRDENGKPARYGERAILDPDVAVRRAQLVESYRDSDRQLQEKVECAIEVAGDEADEEAILQLIIADEEASLATITRFIAVLEIDRLDRDETFEQF